MFLTLHFVQSLSGCDWSMTHKNVRRLTGDVDGDMPMKLREGCREWSWLQRKLNSPQRGLDGCLLHKWLHHLSGFAQLVRAWCQGCVLTPVWAICFRVEFDDPCGFLPVQNILWSVISHLYEWSGSTGCTSCVNHPTVPSEWITHISLPWLIKRGEIVTQLLIRYPIQSVNDRVQKLNNKQKELWWEWQTWSRFLSYTYCQQLRIESILLRIMLILWFNYLFQLYTLIICTCVVIQVCCCITLQNQISMQC